MDKNILGTNIVTQVAFVVHDIEKTSRAYADFLGMEKPEIKITGPYESTGTVYRGEPSKTRAKLAFFKVGENLSIELIEPDKEPSTWREVLDRDGEGFHHIAFVIEGTNEKITLLERNGIQLIQKGQSAKGSYAYVDAEKDLKTIIELLETFK